MRGFDGPPPAARQSGPGMMRFPSAIDRSAEARGVRRRRRLAARDHARAVALYLAGRPARPASFASPFAMVLLLAAKLATIAVPFTFKWATDALTGQGTAPVAPSSWLVWVFAAPILMTIAYGGMRILMAVLTQVRDGIFAKVAMNAVRRLAYPHLRAHAPALAALPSRAQDRRPDARARARPQRHRDHRAHGDHAARADDHRARADRRSCCSISSTGATCVVILVVVACYMVFTYHGDRVAHQHPPPDERQRHRRQRQGDQLAAQLRDGEIFRRRGARGRALRPLDGALRGGERRRPMSRSPCSMPGRRRSSPSGSPPSW